MAQDDLDILSIGEAMAEISESDDGALTIGFAGDTYNTAVYGARLLGEGRVGYLTRVGSDPLSQRFLAAAKSEGVDCSAIQRDEAHNLGIYSVTTDDGGERSFHYWRSQSAARHLADAPLALPTAKIVYLSAISLAVLPPDGRAHLIAALRHARENGALIAFDSNYRPRLWEDVTTARAIMETCWLLADIALPSIDDEMALTGEDENAVRDRFFARNWTALAIKRGSLGPLAPDMNGDPFNPVTRVVDTTAAGDSFNAGYLAAYLHGESERSCLERGHRLASRVIEMRGAIIPPAAMP